jgi:AraC-like DNA-binding protein
MLNHFARIYVVHKILSQSRRPVSLQSIQEQTGYFRATVNRIIRGLRENLFAPLEYDREANGYYYEKIGEHPYELPGLWFSASEVHALLSAQQLLAHVQPGLLEEYINPLRKRIERILKSELGTASEVGRRVRILKMAARQTPCKYFQIIAGEGMNRPVACRAQHLFQPCRVSCIGGDEMHLFCEMSRFWTCFKYSHSLFGASEIRPHFNLTSKNYRSPVKFYRSSGLARKKHFTRAWLPHTGCTPKK